MRWAAAVAVLWLGLARAAHALTVTCTVGQPTWLEGTTITAMVGWQNDGATPIDVVVAPHAFAYTLTFEVRDGGDAVVAPAVLFDGLGDDGPPLTIAAGAAIERAYDVSMRHKLAPGSYSVRAHYHVGATDVTSDAVPFTVVAPTGTDADDLAALTLAAGAAGHDGIAADAEALLTLHPSSPYATQARLLALDNLLPLHHWRHALAHADALLSGGATSGFETGLVQRARDDASAELALGNCGEDFDCSAGRRCDQGVCAAAAAQDPKALVACARAVAKAGGSFTTTRLKALDACTNGILKCVQQREAGAKRDKCMAKAKTGCGAQLAKIDALATTLLGTVETACGAVSDAGMRVADGLGYDGVGDECATTFATTLGARASVEQCVLRQHACRGERILDVEEPRAKELLRVAGVAPASVAALLCLRDRGGDGADLGAPLGAGKAVTTCESRVTKAGNAFVAKRLKRLASCVGAVFACVTTKPGVDACLGKAHAACDKAFTALDAAAATFAGMVTQACGPPAVAFAVVQAAAGADVAPLASDCGTLGVASLAAPADLATCLVRRHVCEVEELLRFEAPRAASLLTTVGRSLPSPFCP